MPANASIAPDPEAVEAFWNVARKKVGHAQLEFILGLENNALVSPPWMQLSDRADQATALAEHLLSEEQIVTASPAESYPDGDDSLPPFGALVIVCDGSGKPVSLARTKDSVVKDDPEGRIVEETLQSIYARP